jgi:hypothetical protein
MAPDKLYFHADSAAVPPGKGVHEQVADPARYFPLWLSAARWREALSDSWEHSMQLPESDRCYESVEHIMNLGWQLLAYDAAEIEGRLPDAHRASFQLFCVHHNRSAMMNFPWMRLAPEEQAMWDAEKWKMRLAAQFAKFSQGAELRALLLATGDAELWEIIARGQKPAERARGLERVRKALREGRTELSAEDFGEDSDEED